MTNEQLRSVLASVPVHNDEQGWSLAPSDQHVTLYAGHEGIPLTIAKVEAVRVEGELVRTRNRKGEVYIVPLAHVFALSVTPIQTEERKAGFAADR